MFQQWIYRVVYGVKFPKSVQVTTVPESKIVDMDAEESSPNGSRRSDGASSYPYMSDKSSLMDGDEVHNDDAEDDIADSMSAENYSLFSSGSGSISMRL